MGSLRFPSWFSQPKAQPNVLSNAAAAAAISSRSFSTSTAVACTVAACAAAFSGIALTQDPNIWKPPSLQDALNFLCSSRSSLPLPWGSLSMSDSSPSIVEPKTGVSFPPVILESRRLFGTGLRKKSLLGLKNIDVYAFGVYADNDELKKLLGEKYGKLSVSELKESKEFKEDIMEADFQMTIRLQIIYGKLSIRSMRNAFEDSVRSRLQKFGGQDSKDLLQRFTSQFKDEYKIPRGSVIHLSREQGHILCTTIDGKEVGSIQSKLLCRSILDLYIGDDPFDRGAREDIENKLASHLQEKISDQM